MSRTRAGHHTSATEVTHGLRQEKKDPRSWVTCGARASHLNGTCAPGHIRNHGSGNSIARKADASLNCRLAAARRKIVRHASGAHARALKHSSGLWEPTLESYGLPQRSPETHFGKLWIPPCPLRLLAREVEEMRRGPGGRHTTEGCGASPNPGGSASPNLSPRVRIQSRESESGAIRESESTT